jgi:hypothetical protein
MNQLQRYSEQTFENIKQYTGEGIEFWYARELQAVLEYTEWRNFNLVIKKAKTACSRSGQDIDDHFVDVNKMVGLGSQAEREIDDIMLSRRESIRGKRRANDTHYQVGAKVRQTINDLGGTMPEDLPTPEKSIQQIKKAPKKTLPKDET